MEIPNMVMKFHNFEIFYKIRYIFDLSSALACRTESINHVVVLYFSLFLLYESGTSVYLNLFTQERPATITYDQYWHIIIIH